MQLKGCIVIFSHLRMGLRQFVSKVIIRGSLWLQHERGQVVNHSKLTYQSMIITMLQVFFNYYEFFLIKIEHFMKIAVYLQRKRN